MSLRAYPVPPCPSLPSALHLQGEATALRVQGGGPGSLNGQAVACTQVAAECHHFLQRNEESSLSWQALVETPGGTSPQLVSGPQAPSTAGLPRSDTGPCLEARGSPLLHSLKTEFQVRCFWAPLQKSDMYG